MWSLLFVTKAIEFIKFVFKINNYAIKIDVNVVQSDYTATKKCDDTFSNKKKKTL